MKYRPDKYGNELSVLGYGCLRFPKKRGGIDLDAAEQQIMAAFRAGINYFDTAYIYPGSEAALGEIFEKHGIRDQVYIGTKLPHYLIQSRERLEKLFQEQLKRLRTDYIDYYFMHMLTDARTWDRLKDLGMLEWLAEKKASGAIRQVGFSYHGSGEMFRQVLDAWDWDFCMIQYNYMDEYFQAGRNGLHCAHEKGIPVLIMEPLRGGKLVSRLPERAKQIFADYPVQHTPAQWAFRWLWDQPEITCVLSGMNSQEMVADNVQTACDAAVGDLTGEDQAMLRQVVKVLNAAMKVGCTGCGYCMPCPKNVDIPGAFSAYNRKYAEGWYSGIREHIMGTALRKDGAGASNCTGCGKCEKHCPQNIEIRKELQKVRKELEGPLYALVRRIVRLLKAF